jgi:molybdate transport system substrate-binding protein
LSPSLSERRQIFQLYSYRLLLLAIAFLPAFSLYAETLNVAVASNFDYTLRLLAEDFSSQSTHELRIISGSTGKLYTQIKHGAPFDVFMAADEKRPELLISENRADKASAYVYAIGQIVLLSNIAPLGSCREVLASPDLHRLSIANPDTAPYGAAAKQVMESLSLWQQLQAKLVMGENAAQALQFVTTKNAQAGFIARSILNMGKAIDYVCTWDVPADMYSPISQEMVLLNRAKDNAAAQAFMHYMQSEQAKAIIKASGYGVI